MHIYLDYLRYILQNGKKKIDRTGIGTLSVFGYMMRFNLQEGFPLITTKKIHLKSVIHELLWFLRGETNVRSLQEAGVRIWNEWADDQGNLGPIYGKQWRAWGCSDGRTIDQLAQLVESLRTNPSSRRLILHAWNVGELESMALPPCHLMSQFYVSDGRLSCMLSMRSSDAFLGLPFNIASYALLTHMMAQQCDLGVDTLIVSIGDGHLYSNHLEQVHLQLERTPLPLPTLKILRKPASLFEYVYEDFLIENYQHHPAIVAPVAV